MSYNNVNVGDEHSNQSSSDSKQIQAATSGTQVAGAAALDCFLF